MYIIVIVLPHVYMLIGPNNANNSSRPFFHYKIDWFAKWVPFFVSSQRRLTTPFLVVRPALVLSWWVVWGLF